MKSIKEFYELDAWKRAHELALLVYKTTEGFPKEELFGIVNQLRRAATSITANIAEGFERYHFNDKIRFYYQARGSIAEVQNFLILARDLKMISHETMHMVFGLADECRQLINGLVCSIESKR